ncbi:MAG: curli production assembly protein CsgG [Magnetococcales bacterium]|nr:curli production assembly protein CsgG [Magnetococcales bacterium]MBF0260863.1 curli production assembly protein CsgG [Magnetococcales bacterium]
MSRSLFSALWLSGLLVSGCAPVENLKVEQIPNPPPAISEPIKAQPVEPARLLKRKVAIARFSNETRYGQGFLVDENKDPVGKQAMDILSARLTSTQKFLLLERADLDKILRELKIGTIDPNLTQADHIIVGSVSEFGRKATSDVGIFNRTLKQTVNAKVNIRLVDVASGQIVYSEEGAGEAVSDSSTTLGVGTQAGYDASLNDKAISAAISKLVNNLIERLSEKPWRGYLLTQQGQNYLMTGGKSQGIRVGDQFRVMRKGERIKNPQTGMMIELPGAEIATVQVSTLLDGADPNNEVSLVRVVSGSLGNLKLNELHLLEGTLVR